MIRREKVVPLGCRYLLIFNMQIFSSACVGFMDIYIHILKVCAESCFLLIAALKQVWRPLPYRLPPAVEVCRLLAV